MFFKKISFYFENLPFIFSNIVFSLSLVLIINIFLEINNLWLNIMVIFLGSILFYFIFYPYKENFRFKNFKKIDIIFFFFFLSVVLLRFPLYFPLTDDLNYHLIFGGYLDSIWHGNNFMPLSGATYMYTTFQILYNPLVALIGIRLTLFLISLLQVSWYFSLMIRFGDNVNGQVNKFFIKITFLFIYFVPYLMAVNVSFCVDFIALIFALEMLFQYCFGNSKDYAIIFGLMGICIKQSTGVFLIPILFFMFFKNFILVVKSWRVWLLLFIIFIFFVKVFFETGNPFGYLFNNFFKSSLASYTEGRDPLRGPQNFIDFLLWPIKGQFSDRYGEGWISPFSRILFSGFTIFPYLFLLFFSLKKKSFLFFWISFLLWSKLSGYSRYVTPLASVSLVFLILNFRKFRIKLTHKKQLILSFSFFLLFFRSIETDFAWRPIAYVKYFNNSPVSFSTYLSAYYKGFSLIFKDRYSDMADFVKGTFDGFSYIVPFMRNSANFYSFLGYLNGLRVIDGISSERYLNIVSDIGISNRIRDNLMQISLVDKFLLVTDSTYEKYILTNGWIWDNYICQKKDFAKNFPFFQRDYYFSNMLLYDCYKSRN